MANNNKQELSGEDFLIIENVLLWYLDNKYCRKHPGYRAKREPKCDCGACRDMWKVRLKLISMEAK